MPTFDPTVVAAFAAQSVVAAVMAILLLGFHRQYGKSYLLHWTLSWAALTAYYADAAIGMGLAIRSHMASNHPVRILTAAFGGVIGYLQIVWLLFGVYEVLRRRPVRIRFYWRTLAIATAFGLLMSFAFIGHDAVSSTRYFLRVGIRCLIAAVAYGVASYAFWHARRRRKGVGFTMMSLAFLLYAFEQIRQVSSSVAWQFFDRPLQTMFIGTTFDFLLQAILGMSMIASLLEDEREASELASEEVSHLAYTDALTGLPNRPLFMDHLILALAQASRSNQRVAVFFLDLDRFKDINDSLGHSTGDVLLKSVAERIRHCVREGDTVARFGGDEFTLLIPKIDNIEDAAKIAQKIHETLKIPFVIADRELFITASVGISVYPADGLDPETLVRNADTAMYRAKDSGRDSYQLYAPAMNAQAVERLALENMLRRAIENEELVLFYQPLVDAESKAVVGFEALIRWQHPELGLLSPAHFIGAAELSGLIVPIGSWVLKTACKQTKLWHKRIDSDLKVSVNLSARQFQQPNLIEEISNVLEETGLRPGALELEITESNAMQNAELTIHTLREIKALGVRIAMDDFGTGYSSLNYLKRFPIDTLKLDRSFIREVTTDATDAAIVNAVIAMAHSLNLKVVAEGVETEDQLEALRKQKCDRIQGYLFSKPLPVDQLEAYLLDRKAISA
jgi:diguanylate cyclase (GGDEF)-like protein